MAIDHHFITDYDYWPKSKYNCDNNSAVKYIKNFKKIIVPILDNGCIDCTLINLNRSLAF